MDWLTREVLGDERIPEWELRAQPGPVGRRMWPRRPPYSLEQIEQHRVAWAGTADLSVEAAGCNDPYSRKSQRLLDVIRRWKA